MSNHPTEGYQPDPAAETRALIEAFFAALADFVPKRDHLIVRLRARHERLLADQQYRVIDEASRHNLALSLAVLAGYQELAAQIGDDELIPLLRTAFVEPLRATVQQATTATLDAAPD